MELTQIQGKFIAALLEAIKESEELILFATTSESGKSTAIDEFDRLLNARPPILQYEANEIRRALINPKHWRTSRAMVLGNFSVEFQDRFAKRQHLAVKVVDALRQEANPYQVIELLIGVIDAQTKQLAELIAATPKTKIIPLNGFGSHEGN